MCTKCVYVHFKTQKSKIIFKPKKKNKKKLGVVNQLKNNIENKI